MRSPESRARAVAGRLAAATGTEARTTETPDAIRVEADVPEAIGLESLAAIVAALGTADHYGHDLTSGTGVAWAEIDLPGRTDREDTGARNSPHRHGTSGDPAGPPGNGGSDGSDGPGGSGDSDDPEGRGGGSGGSNDRAGNEESGGPGQRGR
ncbi:hypothetical protein POF50_019835 [Streptomyces sp. SL13]|uniref:Uncharacterized protein n=1 Tax=Streptantibioticus silvisoli TaxID=2705255 RepID=A0AA90H071_9ACTN|nr:hypothetical protein [Streptantibioticus silvisoli]MDI5971553.1 hypothetical protein [Streptantibioticus silvisoli]